MKTATSHMTDAQIRLAELWAEKTIAQIDALADTGVPYLTATATIVRQTAEERQQMHPDVAAWALRLATMPDNWKAYKDRKVTPSPRSIWDQFWSAMS